MEKETILNIYEKFADEIYENASNDFEMTEEVFRLQNKFYSSLSDEQKKMFEHLQDFEYEKNEAINKNTFIYAFSLATKLFIEGLAE